MALDQTSHRPWPMPSGSWLISMRWEDLLFMHWPVSADKLGPLIPAGLELDLFDGAAWLGIVPFRMCDTRLRLLPPIPFAGSFPELNVRTYVRHGGKPGVWFFSLDAASALAVRTARRFFHLPYMDARMSVKRDGDVIGYTSSRTDTGAPPADFRARYRPTSGIRRSKRGSLEHWLTERYCLYAIDADEGLWRGEIHHAPWPLQDAESDIEVNSLAANLDVGTLGRPSLLHYARQLDVHAWRLVRATPSP